MEITRNIENFKRAETVKFRKTNMKGKISIFGGKDDPGMKHEEGLALFEHDEADRWPDLFNVRSVDLSEGTSKRLRDDAMYFAYRFDKSNATRRTLQHIPWIFRNLSTGKMVMARLVDWGPHERTGRTFDVSPRVAQLLKVKTDDELEAYPVI